MTPARPYSYPARRTPAPGRGENWRGMPDTERASLARAWYEAEQKAGRLKRPTMDDLRAADRVASAAKEKLWDALTADAEHTTTAPETDGPDDPEVTL